MKHLLYVLFVLWVCSISAQETTVLQINAKWNYKNNYDLSKIKNAVIKFSYLKDQPVDIRKNITAVPVIAIIDKNGKVRMQYVADLSFKIQATRQEIQDVVNIISKE